MFGDNVPTVNVRYYPGHYEDSFKRMFLAHPSPESQIKDFDIDKVEDRFVKPCRKTYRDYVATFNAYRVSKLLGVLEDWIKAQLNIPEWMIIEKQRFNIKRAIAGLRDINESNEATPDFTLTSSDIQSN